MEVVPGRFLDKNDKLIGMMGVYKEKIEVFIYGPKFDPYFSDKKEADLEELVATRDW